MDACSDPQYGARIVAVGADRDHIEGLRRAQRLDIPTFTVALSAFNDRAHWDAALASAVAEFAPELVVLAGFMKLVGPRFLDTFSGRVVNTHPALCPSFPGINGPADALEYGVKITGATAFFVDEGIDTGPIIAQTPVPVDPHDDVTSLHERIKLAERAMLVDAIGRLVRSGWTVAGRTVTFG